MVGIIASFWLWQAHLFRRQKWVLIQLGLSLGQHFEFLCCRLRHQVFLAVNEIVGRYQHIKNEGVPESARVISIDTALAARVEIVHYISTVWNPGTRRLSKARRPA